MKSKECIKVTEENEELLYGQSCSMVYQTIASFFSSVNDTLSGWLYSRAEDISNSYVRREDYYPARERYQHLTGCEDSELEVQFPHTLEDYHTSEWVKFWRIYNEKMVFKPVPYLFSMGAGISNFKGGYQFGKWLQWSEWLSISLGIGTTLTTGFIKKVELDAFGYLKPSNHTARSLWFLLLLGAAMSAYLAFSGAESLFTDLGADPVGVIIGEVFYIIFNVLGTTPVLMHSACKIIMKYYAERKAERNISGENKFAATGCAVIISIMCFSLFSLIMPALPNIGRIDSARKRLIFEILGDIKEIAKDWSTVLVTALICILCSLANLLQHIFFCNNLHDGFWFSKEFFSGRTDGEYKDKMAKTTYGRILNFAAAFIPTLLGFIAYGSYSISFLEKYLTKNFYVNLAVVFISGLPSGIGAFKSIIEKVVVPLTACSQGESSEEKVALTSIKSDVSNYG